MKKTIPVLLIFLFCCYYGYSQVNNNNEKDTIYIYKGYWSNVDGLPYYPDDYIYLTINHQKEVFFQEKTNGGNRMMVLFTADYIVDSSGIMNFITGKLNTYGILQIEDSKGEVKYFLKPSNEERYNSSSFDYSCLTDLYVYLNSFVEEAEISSRIHGYELGKEGSYTFGVYIIPNNIECFRKLFEP